MSEQILLVGDTHGRATSVKFALRVAAERSIKQIVVLGDWGYWPHQSEGLDFIADVSLHCEQFEVDCYWLDGNHENHDRIKELTDKHGFDNFIPIAPRVHYIPRSCVWQWGELRFMALGGAYSIDKERHIPGHSWWAGETINYADIERAVNRGPIDVMLTHDAPTGVVPWPHNGSIDRKKDLWPLSAANRRQLDIAFEACGPKLLVHGHYHNRYVDRRDDCVIHGLNADAKSGSHMFLPLTRAGLEEVRDSAGQVRGDIDCLLPNSNGNAKADSRRLISFARIVPEIEPGELFTVETNEDGVIRLTPMDIVPRKASQ